MRSKEIKDLQSQKDALWVKLQPELRRKLTAPQNDNEIEVEIRRAEQHLQACAIQEETLKSRIEKLNVQNRDDSAEVLRLQNAQYDLEETQHLLSNIVRNLEEKKFSAKTLLARSILEYPATRSDRPVSTRRTQAMLLAPLGMAAFVIGLLALVEMRGARVSDPDELHTRINLQVIGVVPPLPQVRYLSQLNNANGNGHHEANGHDGVNGVNGNGSLNGSGGLDESGNWKAKSNHRRGSGESSSSDIRARRQLDEFVQSLDHLRVALCTGQTRGVATAIAS